MKRVINIILTLAIVMGMLPIISISAKTDEGVSDLDKAYTHLLNMEVIEEENGFLPTKNVTRAEFTKIVTAILGVDRNSISTDKTYFYDVPKEHFAYNDIIYCATNGIISGYNDHLFKPEDEIKFEEVNKILVCVLGYKQVAEQNGVYPFNYVSQGTKLGLDKNISTGIGSYLTGQQVAAMTFQALNAPLLVAKSYGSDIEYEVLEKETLLSKTLHLKISKGTLTSNGITALSGGIPLENQVTIDNITYDYKGDKSENNLGKQFEIISTTKKDNDVQEIKSLYLLKGRFSEKEISEKELLPSDENVVKYEKDNKEYKLNISRAVSYVYNGEVVTDKTISDLNAMKDVKFRFLDCNIDSKVDYIFIYDFENYVAQYAPTNPVIIVDKNNSAKRINLENSNKKIIIKDGEGNPCDFSKIKANTVLSVLEGDELIQVFCVNETCEGKIEKTSEENGKTVVNVNGEDFVFSNSLMINNPQNVLASAKVKLHFDILGNVADIEVSNIEEQLCGYYITHSTQEKFGENASIKIFTTEGKMVIYKTADTVHFNDVVYKNGRYVDLFKADGELITYKLNSKGEISYIKTAKADLTGNEDEFFVSYPNPDKKQKVYYSLASSIFDTCLQIDNNTVIMLAPPSNAKSADEEKFDIINKNILLNEQYPVEGYHFSASKQAADVVIIYQDINYITFDVSMAVVQDVVYTVDSNNSQTKMLYCVNGTSRYGYKMDAELASKTDVEIGDVVRLGINNGYIRQLEKIFDISDKEWKLKGNPTDGYFGAAIRFAYGHIIKYQGNFVRVAVDKGELLGSDLFRSSILNTSNVPVTLILDSGRAKPMVKNASRTDLQIDDFIIYQTRNGAMKSIIAIR